MSGKGLTQVVSTQ